MDLLQLFLSFITEEFGDKYKGLTDMFKNNTFNPQSLLKNLDFKTILPIIKDFLGIIKPSGTQSVIKPEGLIPIKNIADEKVIQSLNGYLESSI